MTSVLYCVFYRSFKQNLHLNKGRADDASGSGSLGIYALCITNTSVDTNDCWYFHIDFGNKYRAVAWYWPLHLVGVFLSMCCELQNKSDWSWQSPVVPSFSTNSLCLNEATSFLCSLEPPHGSCNSIIRWETVEWCWPRRLTAYIYIYLLYLPFPLSGGLWACFSCAILSLEVGMGSKENCSLSFA